MMININWNSTEWLNTASNDARPSLPDTDDDDDDDDLEIVSVRPVAGMYVNSG
jgi:hypothetical protein